MRSALLLFLSLFGSLHCGGSRVEPASLEPGTESCRYCRMHISELRFAGQLRAPGEEPMFFDDIGCLQAFLSDNRTARENHVAFVTDHRTQEWVLARSALYTRSSVATPMGSGLIAHANARSRTDDPAAIGRSALSASQIFRVTAPPAELRTGRVRRSQ